MDPASLQPPDPPAHPTRDGLLDAAEELFAERGYAAVGMRELVARAGVNLSAVKYHFGSKRELYLETVRRAMGRRERMDVWALLDPAAFAGEPDGEARRAAAARALVRFLRSLFETVGADRELSSCARLMLHEAMEPSEALADVVDGFARPNVRALEGVVAALAPADEPADEEERRGLDARSILGQVLHYVLLRPIVELGAGVSLSDPTTARRIADHCALFSLRALRVREEAIRSALDDETGFPAGGEGATPHEPETKTSRPRPR